MTEFVIFGYGVVHDWNGGENRVLSLNKANAIEYAARYHGIWFPLYREVECTAKQSDATTASPVSDGISDIDYAVIVQTNVPEPSNTPSSQCQSPTTSSSLIDLYS
jgi:hypothetical protein